MKSMDSKRGSVILGVIILTLVIGVVVGGYLDSAMTEYKLSNRTLHSQSALNLAESGIEEAMLAINTDNTSGWTSAGSDSYFKDVSNVSFSDGKTGQVRTYIRDFSSMPIIVAEGRVTDALGRVFSKQVRVDLNVRSMFANGLTAKNSITFSGNNVDVDAYDSSKGNYNYVTNRIDEGSVASISVLVDAVSVSNGDVWGYVATGGSAPDVGPNGSILGEDSPVGVDVDPDRVSTDFTAEFPDATMPALTPDYTSLNVSGTTTIGSAGTTTVYSLNSLSLSGNKKLVIADDAEVVMMFSGSLSTSGNASITVGDGATLEVYVAGNMNVGGNGFVNENSLGNLQYPKNLMIYGTGASGSGQTIKVAGNGQLSAVVYAPNADLEMKGGGNSGTVCGAAVANNIVITGNSNFHYDVTLANLNTDGLYQISFWRELREESEKLDFGDLDDLASKVLPIL